MQAVEAPVRLSEKEFTVGPLWMHYPPIKDLGIVAEWWRHYTWSDGSLNFWWDEFSRPVATINRNDGILTCRVDGEIAGTTLRNPAVTENFAKWTGGEDGEKLCREIHEVCSRECLCLEAEIAVFLNVWLERHGWTRR